MFISGTKLLLQNKFQYLRTPQIWAGFVCKLLDDKDR